MLYFFENKNNLDSIDIVFYENENASKEIIYGTDNNTIHYYLNGKGYMLQSNNKSYKIKLDYLKSGKNELLIRCEGNINNSIEFVEISKENTYPSNYADDIFKGYCNIFHKIKDDKLDIIFDEVVDLIDDEVASEFLLNGNLKLKEK